MIEDCFINISTFFATFLCRSASAHCSRFALFFQEKGIFSPNFLMPIHLLKLSLNLSLYSLKEVIHIVVPLLCK